jgi:hypothetical protein
MAKSRSFQRVLLAAIALALIIAFGWVRPAQATEFRGGKTVIIPAGQTIDDDLIVSADRVEMNGTVKGDLFASGIEVIVNGTVEGSAIVAGYSLRVNGLIKGSLYGGGYSLTLGPNAEVGRNTYFGGFSFTAENGSSISRSLYAGDYQTLLNGDIGDDVAVGGAALEINGNIGGNVYGQVGETDARMPTFIPAFPGAVPIRPPGLRVGPAADIGGDFEVEIAEIRTPDTPQLGDILLSLLGRALAKRAGEFIAILLVGGALIWFWPRMLRTTREQAEEKALPSAGWGCVLVIIFFVGVPLAAGIILLLAVLGGAVTFGELFNDILGIGGASLALIVTGFFFVLALVTKTIVSFLGGSWILSKLASNLEESGWGNFGALVLGAFIYEILRAIPLGVGWLFSVIATLIGMGAIFLAIREKSLLSASPAK